MHDDTPGGLAVKDRALAYWTDPKNFPAQPRIARRHRVSQPRNAAAQARIGLLLGTINGLWAMGKF